MFTITSYSSAVQHPRGEGSVLDIVRRDHNTTGPDIDAQFDLLDKFVGPATRVLTVQFTLYAHNLDLFVVTTLLFETFESGGISLTPEMIPLRKAKKEWYAIGMYWVLVLYVIYLFVVEFTDIFYSVLTYLDHYYTYMETVEGKEEDGGEAQTKEGSNVDALLKSDDDGFIQVRTDRFVHKKQKISPTAKAFTVIYLVFSSIFNHFASDWNIIDWAIAVLLVGGLAKQGSVDHYLPNIQHALSSMQYQDFNLAAQAWSQANICLSLTALFAILRLLRIASFIPHIGPHAAAIVRTIGNIEVVTYVAILMIVIASFTFCITGLFGYQLEEFRNVRSTFFSVLSMALEPLGDNDFESMAEVHYITGPALFILSVGFMNLILLNTFIAVIGQVYQKKLSEADRDWGIIMVASYREHRLGLAPISRSRGSLLTLVLYLLNVKGWSRLLRRWELKGHIPIPFPEKGTDSDSSLEHATRDFFCKYPHLSPWDIVAHDVKNAEEEKPSE